MVELFVWHEQNYQAAFKSWPGMVGRHIDQIAQSTVSEAIPLIGNEYAGESSRSGTGGIAQAMRVEHEHHARSRDVQAKAGANPEGTRVGYAIYHHEPTGEHPGGRGRYPIRPVRARRLVFYWRRVARVVVRQQVNHPGSAGQYYLLRALEAVMASR